MPLSFKPWALNPPDNDERALLIQCLSYAINKVFTQKEDRSDFIDDSDNDLAQINSTEQTMVAEEDRTSSRTLADNNYQSYADIINFCKALVKNPLLCLWTPSKG